MGGLSGERAVSGPLGVAVRGLWLVRDERIGGRGRTGHASACDGGILVPDDPEEW